MLDLKYQRTLPTSPCLSIHSCTLDFILVVIVQHHLDSDFQLACQSATVSSGYWTKRCDLVLQIPSLVELDVSEICRDMSFLMAMAFGSMIVRGRRPSVSSRNWILLVNTLRSSCLAALFVSNSAFMSGWFLTCGAARQIPNHFPLWSNIRRPRMSWYSPEKMWDLGCRSDACCCDYSDSLEWKVLNFWMILGTVWLQQILRKPHSQSV